MLKHHLEKDTKQYYQLRNLTKFMDGLLNKPQLYRNTYKTYFFTLDGETYPKIDKILDF